MNSLDGDKLKKVYADLGEVLGIEPGCITVRENNMPYREDPLSEVEKSVFIHIRKHPGTSKEEVVSKVKNRSRVTILKTIKNLAEDGLIFDKEDKNNRKRRHLFINTDNELASLITKLDSLKESYFSLLDKTQSLEDNLISNMSFYDKSKLIEAVVLPFKAVMLLVQYDLFGHIEKIPNKYLVEKKAKAAHTTMQQIHLKLYESKILKMLIVDSEEELLIHLFMNTSNGLSPENIIGILETFKKFGLKEYVGKLIDSLWDISYPVLPFVHLHYSRKKYDAVMIKNWRKVMSEHDHSTYKSRELNIRH